MGTKPWYMSKTLWGSILTALIGIYVVVRNTFPTLGLPAPDAGLLGTLITLLASLGIIGRVTATTTLTK